MTTQNRTIAIGGGLIVLVAAVLLLKDQVGNILPAVLPPGGDIAKELSPGQNMTDFPLTVPDGFKIEVFADKLPGARVIVQDGFKNFWVSQPSQGTISQIEMGEDGSVKSVHAVFRNLRKPHGLAIDPQNGATMLYFAEEHRLMRVPLYSDGSPEKLADLPSGGRHTTRTLGFGPDHRLYVSIGSSCDTCFEEDPRRAAIYVWDEANGLQPYAKGLRNSVFFTWDDAGRMWATEMGRDFLGDNLPPDEINLIKQGKDYGWPLCYGKNVYDVVFDGAPGKGDPCADKEPSAVDLQAHSAPLGIAVAPDEWPGVYRGDLIVSFHGSWNRSEPTGYKLARVKMNMLGQPDGIEDFITGWLPEGEGRALGRPVDVLAADGALYVTDDKAGLVYKISQKTD